MNQETMSDETELMLAIGGAAHVSAALLPEYLARLKTKVREALKKASAPDKPLPFDSPKRSVFKINEEQEMARKAAILKGTCPDCDGEGEQGGQFCGGYWKCLSCSGTGKCASKDGATR